MPFAGQNTPTPTQHPPRPRGLATERAILDATLQILHQGGYAALTIDRVAATARASKTTIYRRWKTKEHLVLAVFEQMPITSPAVGGSLAENLTALFGQFSSIMQDSPLRGVLPNLVAECINNPALSSALTKVNDRRRAPIRHVLQHAVEQGELSADTNIELVIDTIQGAIAIRLYFLLDTLSDDWIHGLVQLLLDGTGKKKRKLRNG